MQKEQTLDGDNEELSVAGEKLAMAGLWIAVYGRAVLLALALAAFPAGAAVFDIYLTPHFVAAFAGAHGIGQSYLGGHVVPWVVTFATTGVSYSLWDRVNAGFANRKPSAWVWVGAAVVVALADAAMDAGGYIAWRYGPEAGANIVPPHASMWQNLTAGFVFAFSLVQEPLVQMLLKRAKNRYADADDPGDKLLRGGIWLGGSSLNLIKGLSIPVGAFSVLALDFVLTPQIGVGPITPAGAWLLSGCVTVFGWLAWLQVGHVGFRALSRSDKIMWCVGWVLMLVDLVFDELGYTTGLFGDGEVRLIPQHPTLQWGLGAVVAGILTFAGERIVAELHAPVLAKLRGRSAGWSWANAFRRTKPGGSSSDLFGLGTSGMSWSGRSRRSGANGNRTSSVEDDLFEL